MKDVKIDLGVSSKDAYGEPGGKPEEKPVYPVFHYSGPEDLDLPDHGQMVIHFRKTSETSRTKSDGKHWYECDIEVHRICGVEDAEPTPPTRRDTSAADALDALAKALEDKQSDD